MNGPLLWRNPRRSGSILSAEDTPLERMKHSWLVLVVRRRDIHRVVLPILWMPGRRDEFDFMVHPRVRFALARVYDPSFVLDPLVRFWLLITPARVSLVGLTPNDSVPVAISLSLFIHNG